jgi:hypothetical protein
LHATRGIGKSCAYILFRYFLVVENPLLPLHGLPNPFSIVDKPIHYLLFVESSGSAKLTFLLVRWVPWNKVSSFFDDVVAKKRF